MLSATDVHGIVCEFVTAQAQADGGWPGYRELFLSADVQGLIRTRLAAASAPETTSRTICIGSEFFGDTMPAAHNASDGSRPGAPVVQGWLGGKSLSPADVHGIVCEFVTAQAQAPADTAASGGWPGYRDVFLSADVQGLIRAGVQGLAGGEASSPAKETIFIGSGSDSNSDVQCVGVVGGSRKKRRKTEAAHLHLREQRVAQSEVRIVRRNAQLARVQLRGVEKGHGAGKGCMPAAKRRSLAGTGIAAAQADRAGWDCEFSCGFIGSFEEVEAHEAYCQYNEAAVWWTVCCLDNSTFSIVVPEHARVAEIKRAIGVLREVQHSTIELFVLGADEPLGDEWQLSSAERVPLFMLLNDKPDRLALEAVFKSCGGVDWVSKGGWMTDADLGKWCGVTVNAEGRVIELELTHNNLAGPLPSELRQLSALKGLDLNSNALTGPVPAELGELSRLAVLSLFNNKLSGSIPSELGQLSSLTVLSLSGNLLTGPVPMELGQLRGLNALYLHNNLLSDHETFRLDLQQRNPGCSIKY
jgi:hypothetical protein